MRRLMLTTALERILRAPEDDTGAEPPIDQAPVGDDAPPAEEPPAGEDAPPADDPPSGDDSPPADPPPPTRVPWQSRRIDSLTSRAKTAEEIAAAKDAELAATKARLEQYEALYGRDDNAPAAAAPPAAAPPAGERVFTAAEVQSEAAKLAARQALEQRLEGIYQEGGKTYGADWQKRLSAAGAALGPELQARPDFFEVLSKLPNAVDVYYKLAGDPDHLAEVLAMQGADLGLELAKVSSAATVKAKPKTPSKAPPPIDPIDANGSADENDLTKVDMAEYAARREKQIAERNKQKYG